MKLSDWNLTTTTRNENNVAQDSNLFNQGLFTAEKCGQEDFNNNWASTLEAPISSGGGGGLPHEKAGMLVVLPGGRSQGF